LLIVFAAGTGSAQMAEESCHENSGASGPHKMVACCCTQSMVDDNAERDHDSLVGASCCLPQTCTIPLVSHEISLCSVQIPNAFDEIESELMVFQPVPLLLVEERFQLPPPRPPPAPIFIQHCSFLI